MPRRLLPLEAARRQHTIRTLHAEGATTATIAKAIGLTPQATREWINRTLPDLATPGTYIDLDDIRHLASFGYGIDAIARQLNIQPASIRRRLQRRQQWQLLDRITTHQPARRTA